MLPTMILLAAIGAPCDGDTCRVPVAAIVAAPLRVTLKLPAMIAKAKPVRRVLSAVADKRFVRLTVGRIVDRVRERPRLRRVRRAVFGR